MAETGVLITGFPEPIAERLVARLLDDDDESRFVFVVEPRLVFVAHDRCRDLERHYPQLAERWHVAPGDLCQPDLGLTPSALALVREQVRSVWHLADSRGRETSLASAYTLDVTATTRMLELCETLPALELFAHLSSARVAGDRRGRVFEDELDVGQGFDDPRDRTKCWAEQQVQQRWARIPTVVFRPSALARAGAADVVRLLRERPRWRPLLDLGDSHMNMVPLEWLVDAMVRLGRDPRARGRVFHLSDPRPPRIRELFTLVGEALGRRVPLIAVPPAARALARASADLGNDVIYDLSNTAERLSDDGQPCPLWQDYLPPLVASARQGVRS